jgi:hypothetical protein
MALIDIDKVIRDATHKYEYKNRVAVNKLAEVLGVGVEHELNFKGKYRVSRFYFIENPKVRFTPPKMLKILIAKAEERNSELQNRKQ